MFENSNGHFLYYSVSWEGYSPISGWYISFRDDFEGGEDVCGLLSSKVKVYSGYDVDHLMDAAASEWLCRNDDTGEYEERTVSLRYVHSRREVAYGGVGIEPFEPNEDDWQCQVDVDGEHSYKSCPAIALSCAEEIDTEPYFPIPNLFMVTYSENRVVSIDFDEREYKTLVAQDGHFDYSRGIAFIDQCTFVVASHYTQTVVKYDVNGTYLGVFADTNSSPVQVVNVDENTVAVSSSEGIPFFDHAGEKVRNTTPSKKARASW